MPERPDPGQTSMVMFRAIRTTSIWLLVVSAVGLMMAQEPPPASAPARPPAAGSSTGPSTASDAQRPTFRAAVDSVSVDVIVTDKQGRAVTDLTPADFEVREAGKPQTIDTFKLIRIDDGYDDARAAREILSFDEQQREAAREDNRLLVIFLDDYHVRLGNGMQIRERLANFVRQLTPHDLVAIATPLLPTSGITFSRNHLAIASEIMAFEGRKYDYRPRNALEERYRDYSPQSQEQLRNDIVISAMRSLCEYLGTLRDGRKTVLYVSEGLSGSLPPGMTMRGSQLGPSSQAAPPTSRQQSQAFFDTAGLLNNMQRVFESATRANTAIYTVDPRGLANFEFGVNEVVGAQEDRQMLNEMTDSLRIVAEQTDGRAIVNRNDPINELKQMVRDNSTYYLLSYTSTLAPRDGKFHEIQVRVKRKDVEVRARKGYWAYSTEDIARATAAPKAGPAPEISSALDDLVSTLDGGRAHAVSVWLGATRGVAEKGSVTMAWEITPGGSPDPLDAVDRVTVTATSIYGDELFRGPVARDPQAGRPAGQVRFDAPPGTVRVRVVSESAKGVRLETSDLAVEVPDFTSTSPQLTSPFLYRGRTARDIQAIRAATAPMPVALRSFSRTERVLVRFGAFGPAASTPAVKVRLLNQHGESLASLPDPVRGEGNMFEEEFGLGSVPPGNYLIEIAAEWTGERVTRVVAIRVTG